MEGCHPQDDFAKQVAARVSQLTTEVTTVEAARLSSELASINLERAALHEEQEQLSAEAAQRESEAQQRLDFSRILVEEESARVGELRIQGQKREQLHQPLSVLQQTHQAMMLRCEERSMQREQLSGQLDAWRELVAGIDSRSVSRAQTQLQRKASLKQLLSRYERHKAKR